MAARLGISQTAALRAWSRTPCRISSISNISRTSRTSSTSSTTPRCLSCRPFSSSPRSNSDAPPPPLLAKLRGDLKAAMKAKDTNRLSVLRAVLAATLNASKTDQPITTDAQLVALLRRSARTSEETAAEFRSANRADLAEKEEAQVAILEAYASDSGIESIGTEQIQVLVRSILAEMEAADPESVKAKGLAGVLMKRLLAPGGPLDGKDVDKKEVAVIVKQMTI